MSEVTIVQQVNRVAITKVSQEVGLTSPGPQGPTGPAGPAGAPGGSAYEHVQESPAATWNVNHNLGRRSHATILDVDGNEIETDVYHASVNSIVVVFPTPQTGTVIVS